MPTALEAAAPRPRSTNRRPFAVTAVLVSLTAVTLSCTQPRSAEHAVSAAPGPSSPATTPGVASTPPPSATTATTSAAAPATPTASGPAAVPVAHFSGPADGALLGSTETKALTFEVTGVAPGDVSGTLDGTSFAFTGSPGAATHSPGPLSDGPHTIVVKVSNATGDVDVRRTFTVDASPPKLAVGRAPTGAKGKP
ncbi:MAG: hypothetical protein QOG49_1180, partial [Frankiaceae bacterium]|nr:hypothetical protein [Frankiaceae bacterium]